ncbi:ATP-binding cassette domain-containing protein [Lusitaniella coriacea LEGE 07157]|uniref:ATP-binding cassette domain-containing protein n=1 Tax=Lusitaniella coriacea LEGE 07157 TaxID=945747 RepID=A0A8J7JCZ5_9CYAN|nr:ATP-binding cassette domain-containing protein [Lusitaniella coriacea]MBE9117765.1 ATP-binding cassette domain-containing protein [Lusitaniella coriacea LEGE 07157]
MGLSLLLQDISFQIERGDRVAILGASGAGKTSLLRLLNRLSEPTQGIIALEGQNYREIPVLQLRRQVALVPQEPRLLGMRVEEALAYPLVLQQVPKREIQQRLEELCNRLRIPSEWRERNELQLSVGQRQLVAIARSLMLQPQILILDEPTSALDIGIATNVLNVLEELARDRKTAILMVNHHLELAQQFCDRVLYLQQGQLLQDKPATAIDWEQLRHTLIQLETQDAQEWGE